MRAPATLQHSTIPNSLHAAIPRAIVFHFVPVVARPSSLSPPHLRVASNLLSVLHDITYLYPSSWAG